MCFGIRIFNLFHLLTLLKLIQNLKGLKNLYCIYILPDCKGGELKVRREVAHRSNAMWGKKPAACSTISTLQEDSLSEKNYFWKSTSSWKFKG